MSGQNIRAALIVVMALVAAAVPAAKPAKAQSVISVSLFYENLAPYGRWLRHPRWGWVWFPTTIDSDWRPYTRGRWIWTGEYGWYWEAEEPWGWAVYHYGRWAYDEEYGWIWVPGAVWAPAWVAFRNGGEYLGWAPLPPETLYSSAPVYYNQYTDMTAAYYRPRWVFVEARFFLAPRVHVYAARPANNYIYINRTVNVTNYVTVNHVVFNRSIEPRRVQLAVGRPIVPTRVHNVTNVTTVTLQRNQTTLVNAVNVYRPVVNLRHNAAPPPGSRAKSEDKPRYAIRNDATPPSERRDQRNRRDDKRDSGPPGSANHPKSTTAIVVKPPDKPADAKPGYVAKPKQPDDRRGSDDRGSAPPGNPNGPKNPPTFVKRPDKPTNSANTTPRDGPRADRHSGPPGNYNGSPKNPNVAKTTPPPFVKPPTNASLPPSGPRYASPSAAPQRVQAPRPKAPPPPPPAAKAPPPDKPSAPAKPACGQPNQPACPR